MRQADKWYAAECFYDQEAGLDIEVAEFEGFWSWNVYDNYTNYKQGKAETKRRAQEQAMNFARGKDGATV